MARTGFGRGSTSSSGRPASGVKNGARTTGENEIPLELRPGRTGTQPRTAFDPGPLRAGSLDLTARRACNR